MVATLVMVSSSFIFGNHHFFTTCVVMINFSVTFQKKFTQELPPPTVVNELSTEVSVKHNQWMICCIAIQVTGSSTSSLTLTKIKSCTGLARSELLIQISSKFCGSFTTGRREDVRDVKTSILFLRHTNKCKRIYVRCMLPPLI